jgi:hypothetical protein
LWISRRQRFSSEFPNTSGEHIFIQDFVKNLLRAGAAIASLFAASAFAADITVKVLARRSGTGPGSRSASTALQPGPANTNIAPITSVFPTIGFCSIPPDVSGGLGGGQMVRSATSGKSIRTYREWPYGRIPL